MAGQKIISHELLLPLIVLILIIVDFTKLNCEILIMFFNFALQLKYLIFVLDSFEPVLKPEGNNQEKK